MTAPTEREIEAVARAICDAAGFHPDSLDEDETGVLAPLWTQYRDEAIAAIRALEAAQGWQPIETAPKDDAPVDLWGEGYRWTRMFWIDSSPQFPNGSWGKELTDWYDAFSPETFTHWMPLPAAPVAEPAAPEAQRHE